MPAQIIALPTTFDKQNAKIKTFTAAFQSIHNPNELDAATQKEGLPASLLNFHFATKVDLSSMDLGEAVHIPVQVSLP